MDMEAYVNHYLEQFKGSNQENAFFGLIEADHAIVPILINASRATYDDTFTGLGTTQYYYSVKATNACGDRACSSTDAGRPGGPAFDFNLDCDVDRYDHDSFEGCASGPGVATNPGCEAADLDLDNDVDQSDFSVFQRCLSGENVPADPDCAN